MPLDMWFLTQTICVSIDSRSIEWFVFYQIANVTFYSLEPFIRLTPTNCLLLQIITFNESKKTLKYVSMLLFIWRDYLCTWKDAFISRIKLIFSSPKKVKLHFFISFLFIIFPTPFHYNPQTLLFLSNFGKFALMYLFILSVSLSLTFDKYNCERSIKKSLHWNVRATR